MSAPTRTKKPVSGPSSVAKPGNHQLSLSSLFGSTSKLAGTYLGGQSLEETRDTLVPHHFPDYLKPALWVLKIPVLYSSFNDIQRSRDDQRRAGSGNRGDKILHPAGFVVVCEFVQILLGEGGASKELISRCVSFVSQEHCEIAYSK